MTTTPVSTRPRRLRSPPRALRAGPLRILVASAIPLLALAWFFVISDERRRSILESIPAGAGERAVHAGIAFGVLVALAWFLLPISHGGEWALRRALDWLCSRSGAQRALLYPAEAVLRILHLLFHLLFWVIVVAVLAACLAVLLFIVWIVQPGFLGGSAPLLDWVREAAARVGVESSHFDTGPSI